MSKSKFPVSVKRGSAVGKINETPTKGYTSYTLVYWLDGQRRRKTFSRFDVAKTEAEAVATQLGNGEVDSLALSREDKAAYARAVKLLEPCGMPLELAAAHVAEAVKILGSDRILEACRYFAKTHPTQLPKKQVADVVNELIADTAARGLSKRYQKTLNHHCGKFTKSFSTAIHGVSAYDVRKFLDSLKIAPRSRNNFLGSIKTLFPFAQ